MMRTILGRSTLAPVCAGAAEEADMAAETPVSHSLRVEPDDGSGWTPITAVSRIGRLGRTRRSVTIVIFLGQVTRCVAADRVSRNCGEIRGLPVQLKQETLNRLYLMLLEIRLTALAAHPGRNCLQ
jgi:hypothetical protein